MHVVFVEPAFPTNQREFVRVLSQAGARVTGIGEAPVEALGDELRHQLFDYIQVRTVVSESELMRAVRQAQEKSWVDRLEATVEAHILPTAKVREACQIPGTSERTAFLCRDKPAMKEALREAGVPCAQSTGANSPEEVREFVAQVGYPVIIKPRDAAGAAGTWKASDDDSLASAISASGVEHGASVAVEEFIEGHEGFYDTITIDGEVQLEFISHYYPNVLEAMRERWISPQIAITNRMDSSGYEEVKELGRRVGKALGIETSATHMEWFFGPKGLKFSEIGCRPPGVSVWDLYSAGNDLDIYQEWANAIVHSKVSRRESRRFATGMIALRPDRDGQIVGYEGVEDMLHRHGDAIIDYLFPPVGSGTQPVEAGYKANAWVRVRHTDYDAMRGIMSDIGERVRVRAG